jgi:Flp pilus assembly protein TadD
MSLGKGEEAVRISREMAEKNPQDAGLRANHALALLIAGHIQEAESEVHNALKLQPEDKITRNLAKFIDDVRTNRVPRPDRWPMP